MKSEDQPTEVSDNSLTFEKDPGYQTGDVLVAGEISAAPSGFIRKVVQIEKRIRVTGRNRAGDPAGCIRKGTYYQTVPADGGWCK